MSDHLPAAESTPPSRDLRVAVIIPNEHIVISSSLERPALFVDSSSEGESLSHEHRATRIHNRLPLFGLPPMSAVKHLGAIDGIPGYAVRPASGNTINTRLFTTRAFHLDDILALAERDPDFVDTTDLDFIKAAFLAVRSAR